MQGKLHMALVQAAPAWHDPAANRELFQGMMDTIEAPVDVVVLPEMFSTGFTMCSAAMAEGMDGETVAWLRDQAARRDVTITGSVVIEDGQRFNRQVWMPPHGHESVYDKRHLFRMAGEHEHYAPGSERIVVEMGPWRICLCVCYDLRFPVWLRSHNDYDVLLCVANWPAARQSAWATLLRARAIENQCYAVGVNRVGVDGNGVVYRGGSAVFDGEGAALAQAGDEPGILSVTLDLDALREYRDRFPAWRDADTFEVAP
ncbi:MAG: amidohydrolase [Gammaproteobacteria bacterium]|nr:amidohydrolase [Gammaproteobacteria bacterium]